MRITGTAATSLEIKELSTKASVSFTAGATMFPARNVNC